MTDPRCYFHEDELPKTFYHGQILKFILHVLDSDFHKDFYHGHVIYSANTEENGKEITRQCKWEMVRCIKRPAVDVHGSMTIEVQVRAVSPGDTPAGCLLAPLHLIRRAFIAGRRILIDLFGREPIRIGSGSGSGLGSNDGGSGRGGFEADDKKADLAFLKLKVKTKSNPPAYQDKFKIFEV